MAGSFSVSLPSRVESSDAFCCSSSSIHFPFPASEDDELDAMFFPRRTRLWRENPILLHVSSHVFSPATRHLFPVLFNSQSSTPLVDILDRRILDHSDRYSRSPIVFSVINRVLDYNDRHSQSPIVNLSQRSSFSIINR